MCLISATKNFPFHFYYVLTEIDLRGDKTRVELSRVSVTVAKFHSLMHFGSEMPRDALHIVLAASIFELQSIFTPGRVGGNSLIQKAFQVSSEQKNVYGLWRDFLENRMKKAYYFYFIPYDGATCSRWQKRCTH